MFESSLKISSNLLLNYWHVSTHVFVFSEPWRLKVSSIMHCIWHRAQSQGPGWKWWSSLHIRSMLPGLVRTPVQCCLWTRQATAERTAVGGTYSAKSAPLRFAPNPCSPAQQKPEKCFLIIGWVPEFHKVFK